MMPKRILRYLVSLALPIVLLACQALPPSPSTPTPTSTIVATSAKKAPPVSPVMRDRHRRVFETVWRTVQKHYLYADYRGVDWTAAKQEFAPLVDATCDDATFWALMQTLIDSLGDEHSSFLTPEDVAEEDQAVSGNVDYVGIGVYISVPDDAEYAVILFPLPDSPAARAGLKAHDRVLSVAGESACCDEHGADNLYLLQGLVGTEVEMVVQSPDEQTPRTVLLRRERIQTQVPILSRRIALGADAIGYVMIPTLWDETIAERTRTTLVNLSAEGTLSGLIIDLRVNGGGAFSELYDLLSLFVEGDVGYFYRRNAKRNTLTITLDPVVGTQDIPLIILLGPYTESFAEVLGGTLHAVGRAQLIGSATAGNVETLYPYNLADGSRLWLAEETFIPLSGTRWEGVGVQPDTIIETAWEEFTENDDPYVTAALQALRVLLDEEPVKITSIMY